MTRTRWPAVWAAIAAGIVAAAYVGKLPPAIPLLRAEFGLSLVAAGWVNSIFNTLAVATAVFFGALAGRYGALRCCSAGLIAMMLGGVLGASATGEAVLFASRILEGAGFIAVAVSSPTLITVASTPRERNLTLGLWSIYLPFGVSPTMLARPSSRRWCRTRATGTRPCGCCSPHPPWACYSASLRFAPSARSRAVRPLDESPARDLGKMAIIPLYS